MNKKILSLFFLILKIKSNQEIITNSNDDPDGFGSQFHGIITAVIYASLNNKKFVYTPLKKIDDTIDSDLSKKEWLINFINNVEINEKNHDNHCKFYKKYFDENIFECANCVVLNNIRKLFKANKNTKNYFHNKNLNVAIHINDIDTSSNIINKSNNFYPDIIKKLRTMYSSRNILFHIFSKGNKENFNVFTGEDIILHLDKSTEDTFCSMVFADILVTAPSSFSYVAGILSENLVYYVPFLYKPLPHWIDVDTLLGNVEKIEYNLVKNLPDIYITPFAEKIGTWSNGIVYDQPLIQKFFNLLNLHQNFFVMLDLGAQTGSFSLLAKYFPNSKWYSFEPIQEVEAILKENLIINDIKNVSTYQMAVSDFSGSNTIKMPPINRWGGATLGSNPNFTTVLERKIECIDLDSFIINENIKKVHFMKLDTEGHELFILRGAKKMIVRDKPIILMEYNEYNMKQCNVKKDDIHDLLTELGYNWVKISDDDILCINLEGIITKLKDDINIDLTKMENNINKIKNLYRELLDLQLNINKTEPYKSKNVVQFINTLAEIIIKKFDLHNHLNQLEETNREIIVNTRKFELDQVKEIEIKILDLIKNMQNLSILKNVEEIKEIQESFESIIKNEDIFSLDRLKITLKIPAEIKEALKKYLDDFPNLFKNINELSKDGYTLLEKAIDNKDLDAINFILEIGGNIDTKDINGNTPLIYSIAMAQEPFAVFLIKNNADINLMNKNGQTALSIAKQNNLTSIVQIIASKILVRYLKDLPPLLENINSQTSDGKSALDIATFLYNDINAVRALIDLGANVNVQDNNGTTPLMHAVEYNRPEILRLLIARGADINHKNKLGDSALMYAKSLDYKHIIDIIHNKR